MPFGNNPVHIPTILVLNFYRTMHHWQLSPTEPYHCDVADMNLLSSVPQEYYITSI